MRIATTAFTLLFAPSLILAATIHVPEDHLTIQAGIDAAAEGDTVLVACGTYYESELALPSALTIRSESGDPDCVVIDAENTAWIMSAQWKWGIRVEGVTLRNGGGPYTHGVGLGFHSTDAIVQAVVFENCSSTMFGGASTGASGAEVTYKDCVFKGCSSDQGGAFWCNSGSFLFEGCVFIGNHAQSKGGALAGGATITVRNCTIVDNTTGPDGGVAVDGVSYIHNSVIALNNGDGQPAYIHPNGEITCTTIFGNSGGDWVGTIAGFAEINGNFSLDPLFCAYWDEDYALALESPCLPANNDCGVLIGALGAGCPDLTAVDNSPVQVLAKAYVHPNPFNPRTSISFDLPAPMLVTLVVYDLSGRLVRELLTAKETIEGHHEVEWNGLDTRGKPVSSGVYFYRLNAGPHSASGRMVLLK